MKISGRVSALLCRMVFLAAVFSATSSFAQTQRSATLTGLLTDPHHASIVGAKVSVEQIPSLGAPQLATSATDGRFTLNLVPGRYRITIAHESFLRIDQEISIGPTETREVRIGMTLEPLSSKVVVTAQALPLDAESAPAPVTIITRKQIEERKASSLPDLLATLPGFSLGRTGPAGGTTSLFLDGGNSNYTKVLVDGVPVNQPGGLMDFSTVSVDGIEKIEVVHGAESALYGSDAMDGVIQIFTHRGNTRRPELTAYAEGGNFSAGRGGAELSGLLGRFDYLADVGDLETSGQGPNDAFRNRTLSGNFGWKLRDTARVGLILRDNLSAAGTPGPTLLHSPNLGDSISLHNFFAGLHLDATNGAHWHHHLSGLESYNHELNIDPFFLTLYQFNRAKFTAQTTYSIKNLGITAGYEYEVENGFISFLNMHVRRNNQGGFVDVQWQPIAGLTLSGGLRTEDNASFGRKIVPRAGAAFMLHTAQGAFGDTRVRASYGHGIVEPRFDQSFGSDVCFPGNPNLLPEQSRTVHAGLEQKLASDHVRVTADYFYSRFQNIISFQSVAPAGACSASGAPFGAGTFFNTNLARARGVNLSGEAHPAHWLTLAGNYTYDDTRTLAAPNDFDPNYIPGSRLLRRPANSGDTLLNAAFRRMNWNLNSYFSGRRADYNFPGQVMLAGYARFDLAASYNVSRGFSVYGRIANLGNKHYQDVYGYPVLGREYRFGLRYSSHRE